MADCKFSFSLKYGWQQMFSWLNKKMHNNAEYCTIDENKAMQKEDSVRGSVAEQDTESLLLCDALLNDILAIGTLGHNVNCLCPELWPEQDDEFIIMDSEKAEEEMYEEEKSGAVEAPAIELAKMHSSSLKECNFTCSVKEEIPMCKVEVEDATKIQEQPLLMVEKVEKVRTTLADLFAAEPLSSCDTREKSYPKVVILAEIPTSKRSASCMEKVHQKKPTQKPPNTTRKFSQVMRKIWGKKIHPEHLNGCSNAEETLIT